MTVYVIQDNGTKNFSAAKKYGELVPLIERDAFPDDADERIKEIYSIMEKKLKDFNPSGDYILLTGAPEAIAMAFFLLGATWDIIPTLKWDRDNKGYYEVIISDN